MDNQVNHPSHYGGKDNPYEVIKIIEAHSLDFHLGNTVKYVLRAGKKNPDKELEDLKKALWYLQRKIDLIDERHLQDCQATKAEEKGFEFDVKFIKIREKLPEKFLITITSDSGVYHEALRRLNILCEKINISKPVPILGPLNGLYGLIGIHPHFHERPYSTTQLNAEGFHLITPEVFNSIVGEEGFEKVELEKAVEQKEDTFTYHMARNLLPEKFLIEHSIDQETYKKALVSLMDFCHILSPNSLKGEIGDQSISRQNYFGMNGLAGKFKRNTGTTPKDFLRSEYGEEGYQFISPEHFLEVLSKVRKMDISEK